MSEPSTTLDSIVAHKRVEVAKAQMLTPLDVLRERIDEAAPARNFFRAVVQTPPVSGSRVIAEIKARSPSAGELRRDLDPAEIARAYEDAGAAAISCLTDESHFGGHLGYIQQIRNAVRLPVLRKDFIVDQYQVWESRAAGADAILLIAEVLPEGVMLDMMILARELGMTALVEVHDPENLLKLKHHIGFPHAGYSLLGINNRNLRDMTTSVAHTLRMVDMIDDSDFDRGVIVSESGISTGEDLRRLRGHGVNIALVGESLLRSDDPGDALQTLLHDADSPGGP